MKEYSVDIDITVSKRITVYADDEEQARKIAFNRIAEEPYYYIDNATYVGHGIVDINEET